MAQRWYNGLKLWLEDFKRLSQIDWHWLSVWLSLYLSFLLLDIIAPQFSGSALIKYLGIFLCLVYAIQKYRKDHLLNIAILLTFVADTILVWTNHEASGVFVFCFAQMLHLSRLTRSNGHIVWYYAITIALVLFFIIQLGDVLPIYAATAIYAFLLCANLVLSLRNYQRHQNNFRARCCFYAFLCFVCCDCCVAARHLMLDGLITTQFLPLVSYLVWVFYYPSQVLMANSSLLPDAPTRRKIAK